MTSPSGEGEPLRQDVSAERDAYVAYRQVVNVHHHHGEPAPDRVRLRVFVSWTSEDLRDHREQVRRALRRLGAEEVVAGADSPPVEERLAAVRTCDLYLGVFAWHYGPVPEGHDRSVPELEFRAAVEADIPRLVFLLSEEEPWPRAAMDLGEAGARIEALREELAAAEACSYFTTPADLSALVTDSVEPRTLGFEPVLPRSDPTSAAAWRAYRQRLIGEYGRLDLEALTPPEREEYLQLWLSDVFVEPNVRADAPPVELSKELLRKLEEASELSPLDVPRGLEREDLEEARKIYRTRPTRAAFDVVAGPSERLCVLLGDPGAGKSTIARYLLLALAGERATGRLAELAGHEPVLIELRDYALARPQCENFSEYLAARHRADGLGLPEGVLDAYLNGGGQALVIFDGLDELFDPQEREAVARQIAWFASIHPTARILVTSRIVGYRKRILDEAGFGHHTLQDLNREQVEEFLTSWYGLALHDRPAMAAQRRDRLTKAIEESPPIKELAGNPLLLTILAIIGKHRELPRERWKVYDHAASVLVEHWDVNKHLSNARVDADVIREDDKKDLLRRLAYRMQLGTEGLAGNHIWLEDLVAEIVDYLRDRFKYDFARATSIAHAMVDQFRERNFVLARYGPKVYGFVHRALLEFFCAGEIVIRFEKTRVLSEKQLAVDVFGKHWEDPTWREVLRLIAGMVDAGVTDRLLTRLIESAEPVKTTALDQPPLGATAVAVQCLAEIRNIGAAERSAHLLLRVVIDLLRRADRSFADEREEVLESVVLPAVATLGPTWPSREHYLEWFEQQARGFVTWRACRFAPRLLAALYSDAPGIRTMLTDLAQHDGLAPQRRACLLGVVDTWPDLLSCDLVLGLLTDNAEIVRQAAVEQLAAHWATHPDTLPAIHNALLDPGWEVRRAALQALDAPWAHTPGTFTVIRQAIADIDEDVRAAAVRAVASRWSDHLDAFPAVLAVLRDPSEQVRLAAIEQLSTRWADHPDTLPALEWASRYPNGEVQCAALVAISRCSGGSADALPLLLDRLGTALDESIREAAVKEIAKGWPESPAVFKAVLHATLDPGQTVRAAAYKALASQWPGAPELKAACLRGMRDWTGQVRRTAFETLVTFWAGQPELLPLLVSSAADKDWRIRKIALETLAARWATTPEALAALGRATRDQTGLLRQTGLEALTNECSDLRLAFTALSDPHQGTRRSARDTLVNQWHASWQTLAHVMRASRSPLSALRRTALLRAVSLSAADPATWDTVDGRLRDSDPDVRLAALQALLIGRRDHVETRIKILASTRDPNAEVRSFALEALAVAAGWHSHPETRAALHRAMHDPDDSVALLALETLVVRGPDEDEILGVLSRALRRFPFALRKVSLHLLTTRWADKPEAKATLLDCSFLSDSRIRQDCLQALSLRWPAHQGVLERVQQATLDPADDVRQLAFSLLADRWETHPETSMLVAGAQWDSEFSIRKKAAMAMAFLGGEDPPSKARDPETAARATRHADSCVRLDGLTQLLLMWPDRPEALRAAQVALNDEEWMVRSAALAALVHRWPDEAYTTFRAGLGAAAGAVRQLALWGLVVTRPHEPETRTVLTAALDDCVYFVRRSAVEHIARWWPQTDPDSAEGVLIRMVSDQDDDVRATALAWLTVLTPVSPATLSTLRRCTADPWDRVRRTALEALLILQPDHPTTAAALQRAIHAPGSDDVRQLAREALARRATGRIRDLPQVMTDIRDGHWADRVDAMNELINRWHDFPETFTALLRAATDEARKVRLYAIWRLASRWPHHPAVRPLLIRMASDDYAHLRRVAVLSLTEGPDDPEAYNITAAAVADPYWNNKVMALERLATRWADRTETLPLLRKATKDHDWYGRYIAVPMLHRLMRRGTPEASWAVDCDPAEAVRRVTWTILTCGPVHLPLTPSELLPLWHDDTNSRSRAAMILAPLGGGHADHDVLESAARSQDHELHLPALIALATWWPSNPETVSTLIWATRNACPGVRGFALSALLNGQLARDEAEHLASHALTDSAPEVRRLALQSLQVSGRLDTTTLAAFLTDADPDIVVYAIEMLADQDPDDHELWELIRQAADTCPVPWVRDWLEWRQEDQAPASS
ncbi:MAG TPA: HEAT repeat domain-containing protein [Streptosporangiaceae bacterium]|nr:HEAT repeat domain-containing protein [Streptosporangiaceae bacterium]